MERDEGPCAGEIWRHFKGGRYEIVGISTDTETGAKSVVYLDGAEDMWSRPYDMFMGSNENGVLRFEFVEAAEDEDDEDCPDEKSPDETPRPTSPLKLAGLFGFLAYCAIILMLMLRYSMTVEHLPDWSVCGALILIAVGYHGYDEL